MVGIFWRGLQRGSGDGVGRGYGSMSWVVQSGGVEVGRVEVVCGKMGHGKAGHGELGRNEVSHGLMA